MGTQARTGISHTLLVIPIFGHCLSVARAQHRCPVFGIPLFVTFLSTPVFQALALQLYKLQAYTWRIQKSSEILAPSVQAKGVRWRQDFRILLNPPSTRVKPEHLSPIFVWAVRHA